MTKNSKYFCPCCGANIKSFSSKCEFCGSEVSEVETSKSLKDFFDGLSNIQAEKLQKSESNSLLKKVVGIDLDNILDADDKKRDFEEHKSKKIANYINNYPVPNTKEDLFEFMILASSNYNTDNGSDEDIMSAWSNKMDQIYKKAKLVIKDKNDLEKLEEIYYGKKKEIKKKKFFDMLIIITLFSLTFLILGFIYAPIITAVALVFVIALIYFLYQRIVCGNYKDFKITKKMIISFLAVLILLVIGILIYNNEVGKIKWDDLVLGDSIPEVSGKGRIITNSNKELNINIKNISNKEFYKYIEKCKKEGYTIDSEENEYLYSAFSNDGYKIEVSYLELSKTMAVNLTLPNDYSKIEWSNSSLAKLLPVPNSLYGNVIKDDEKLYNVEISKMNINAFNNYIQKCKNNGFDNEIEKDDKTYIAKNSDNNKLIVKYLGNNIVSISISEPEYNVSLSIKCIENIIFSKYNVKVYIDDTYKGDITHGSSEDYDLKLSKGNHKIRFVSVEDDTVSGEVKVNITNDGELEIEISCTMYKVNTDIKKDTTNNKKEETKENVTKEETKQEEVKEETESEEDRTYNGVVYDKAYLGEWNTFKDRHYEDRKKYIYHYIIDEDSKTIVRFTGRVGHDEPDDLYTYYSCSVDETKYEIEEDGKYKFYIGSQPYLGDFSDNKGASVKKIISLIEECKKKQE